MSLIIKSFRIRTLIVSFIPIFLCYQFAVINSLRIDNFYLIISFITAFSLQITTNIFNDLIDYEKGADVLRSDRVSSNSKNLRSQLLYIAIFFLIISLICGFFFFKISSFYILLGCLSIYFTYGYTGGPFPLAYNALGELFAFIFFGPILCLGSFYAFSGPWNSECLLLSIVCGFFSVLIISLNNYRDINSDKSVGKKTLAVLIGKKMYEVFIICTLLIILSLSSFLINRLSLFVLGVCITPLLVSMLNIYRLNNKILFINSLLSYIVFFLVRVWGP